MFQTPCKVAGRLPGREQEISRYRPKSKSCFSSPKSQATFPKAKSSKRLLVGAAPKSVWAPFRLNCTDPYRDV